MIAIIDYGCGNLKSVKNAFNYAGLDVCVTSDEAEIKSASHVVLPGVGAFGDAMRMLKKNGMDECLKSVAQSGKPLLGICLGMQLLFLKSFEFGENEGLGLIKGEVTSFMTKLKIPHMGWNEINVVKPGILENGYYYFVHSYHAGNVPNQYVAATAVYDYEFVCAVNKDNIWGVQFHPEKSADAGQKIIKRFGALK